VGEGDGGFAEAVRGGRSPPSSLSTGLPLDVLNPSVNRLPSCLPELGLTISLPALLILDPVGCGDRALAARLLPGFEFDICSK
jgi:hypothetical protein